MVWKSPKEFGTSPTLFHLYPASSTVGYFFLHKMAKVIQLTQGKVAIVDDIDFEYLNQFKWYARKSRSQNYYAGRYFYIKKV
jgi:hypothetical protein